MLKCSYKFQCGELKNPHTVRKEQGVKFPVLWLSLSLAKCGRLGVMFLKRLVVYEARYAKKKATSQKGTLPSARRLNQLNQLNSVQLVIN